MREFDQPWSFTGTSGGATAVRVLGDVLEMAFYVQTGDASTATVTIQSGPTSSGPWFQEAVTAALSTSANEVIRLSGPFDWVRPFNNSTGIVTVRAIGVS